MFEYHGWMTIREQPYFVEDEKIGEVIKKIKSYVSRLNWNNGVLDIFVANTHYYLLVTGYKNRNTTESDILDFLNFIAKVAPGSYGLFHLFDDEDKNGKDNKFRVLVLKRGAIVEHEDTFLSPFIPEVEDEYSD